MRQLPGPTANIFSLSDKQKKNYTWNFTLTHGIFLELLKKANVIALPKAGNSTDYSDCRGISLLSVFSRILEKLEIVDYKNIYLIIRYYTLLNMDV